MAYLFGGRKTLSRLLASLVHGEYEVAQLFGGRKDLEQITCQPDTRRTQKVAHLFGGRKDLEQITCQPDTRRI